MKTCPTCKKEFPDDTINFCLTDGATLIAGEVNLFTKIQRSLLGNKAQPAKVVRKEGYADFLERTRKEAMSPEELKEYEVSQLRLQKEKAARACKRACFDHGALREKLICPHCQEKSCVHTKIVKVKKGISGSKATGALLTGGISVLATGLSRKEEQTLANCHNCNSSWSF